MKGVGQSFRCLFIDNSRYGEYLSTSIYAEAPQILGERRIWIPSLKKMVNDSRYGFDLCIAILPSRYESQLSGLYNFKGRKLVRQIIDTSGAWEDVRGRFRKSKKYFSNKILKSGFSYRISNDLKDFDFFYYRMFIPLVSKQFGNLSIIDSYEEMKSSFVKGFLMFVMEGEQSIAASLSTIKNRTLIGQRIGVLEGDERYIKSGMQSALYYFQIRLAKELNLEQVDTMNSRACLNDGIYRHKREWGAAVYPEDKDDAWVYFFVPARSEKAVRFFEQNPVIVHTGKGLMGLTGLCDAEFSAKTKKYLYDQFYAPGLEGILVLTARSKGLLEMPWKNLHEIGQRH